MIDVQQMTVLYRSNGFSSQGAPELQITRNTVKKYLRQNEGVREEFRSELLPETRQINQPHRTVTDTALSIRFISYSRKRDPSEKKTDECQPHS